MSDLTPELLAQLEQDADGWCRNRYLPGASANDEEGEDLAGDEVDPFHVYIRNEDGLRLVIRPECDDMDEFLARALNALPALVAAAKELAHMRDALRQLIVSAETIRIESATHTPYLPKMVHARAIQEVLDDRSN